LALETIFEVPDARIRAAAVQALHRLLPNFSETEAARLTEEQRFYLRLVLEFSQFGFGLSGDRTAPAPHLEAAAAVANNLPLAFAALTAVHVLRDVEAIPIVERMARVSDGCHLRLQLGQFARETLPLLQAERHKQQEAQILLRPTVAPLEGEQSLLRPAGPTPENDSHLLLRPHKPDAP
jgi:hypothetical protein